MALFEKEHYGKPISTKLSERLLIYSTMKDRKAIAESTGVGLETINRVARGTNNLTEENSKAIIELARVAFVKASKVCEQAGATVEELGPHFKIKMRGPFE